jgi:hypothetical protein
MTGRRSPSGGIFNRRQNDEMLRIEAILRSNHNLEGSSSREILGLTGTCYVGYIGSGAENGEIHEVHVFHRL